MYRNRTITSRKGQAGFGMAIALAALAVIALIVGAIAMANKGGGQKTDAETAKVMAQSIINRGNELYTATTRVAQDRDIKTMTFSSTSVAGTSFGLYDPTIGVASDVAVPGKALTTNADTSMTLNKTDVKIIGIGPNGTDALAIVAELPDVTDAACHFINKTIYNSSLDTAIPTVDATTAISNPEGCAVINSKNTYYKVLGSAV